MYIRTVPKEIKDLLHKIAKEQGYEYKLVEDVYFQEFEFVADQMAMGDRRNYDSYQNILLKYLGSFISNEKHINKLIEIGDAKDDKDDKISIQ
jgi:hypothetical protein